MGVYSEPLGGVLSCPERFPVHYLVDYLLTFLSLGSPYSLPLDLEVTTMDLVGYR